MKVPPLRRQSRELALQVLFQKEFLPTLDLQSSLDNFRLSFSAPIDVWKYAEVLLKGIINNQEGIDQKIESHLQNWTISRLSMVDLNLLRISVCELFYLEDPVPPAVTINESMEIAKKYGSSESAKFINGILDQISKQLG